MAKITVTIEADDPTEIYQALRRFLAAAPSADVTTGVREASDTGEADIGWSFEQFATLWENLQPNARELIQELSKQPEEYLIDAVGERLQLTSHQIAGRLSSVGHQMRQFPGKQHPVSWNNATRAYTLSPVFVEYVRRLTA